MPADLLTIVNSLNIRSLSAEQQQQAAAALDAVLAIDSQEAEAFHHELRQHQSFWAFADFTVNNDTSSDWKAVQAAMSLLRVRLELKDAPDQELLAILANKQEAYASYLNERKKVMVIRCSFSDLSKQLKPDITAQLSLRLNDLVNQCESIDKLKTLIEAKNIAEKKQALRNLNFPKVNTDLAKTLWHQAQAPAQKRKQRLVAEQIVQGMSQDKFQLLEKLQQASADELVSLLKPLQPDITMLDEDSISAIKASASTRLQAIRQAELAKTLRFIDEQASPLEAVLRIIDYLEQYPTLENKIAIIKQSRLVETSDWIDEESCCRMHAALVGRAFALQVEQHFLGSAKSRRFLNSLFAALPFKQQQQLLFKAGATKQLMDAKDAKTIERVVEQALDQDIVANLLRENKVYEQKKAIHSIVLAQCDLPLYDHATIAKINGLLWGLSMAPRKETWDELSECLKPYEVSLDQKNSIVRECIAQKALHSAFQGEKKQAPAMVLTILLNNGIGLKPIEPDTINNLLKESKDKDAFIQSLSAYTHNPQEASNRLSKAISFEALQALHVQDELLAVNNQSKERARLLFPIRKQVEQISKEHKDLVDLSRQFVDLDAKWDSYALHKQTDKDLMLKQKEYVELLEQVKLTQAKLERNITRLQACIDKLPQSGAHPEIQQIRNQSLQEQEALHNSIKQYDGLKNIMTSVLQTIDNIRLQKELYVYKADNIAVKSISQEELAQLRNKKNEDKSSEPVNSRILTGLTRDTHPPVLEKATLESGQSMLYTVKTHHEGKQPSEALLAQSPLSSRTWYHAKNDELVKSMGWKVELVQGPQPQSPPHEKVNVYMDMALALIQAHGSVPTKNYPLYLKGGNKQEMELLWTALMILGKEKFHFNQDALVVRNGLFEPEQVMKRGVLYGQSFAPHSCYQQVFSHPDAQAILKEKLLAADKMFQIQKQMDSSSKDPSSVQHFKKQMSNIKTKELLQEEQEQTKGMGANLGRSI